jgi:hypothetical protein
MNDTPSRGKPQAHRPLSPRKPPAQDSWLFSHGDTSEGVGHDEVKRFPPIHRADLPADIVLARLKSLRRRITGTGPSWQACCPAHPDLNPSLSITETVEGILLLHCFGGCDTEDVLAELGLTLRHLRPSLYALQFSKRRPQGTVNFHGAAGGDEAPVTEPTEETCAEWARRLQMWSIPSGALRQLAGQLQLPLAALRKLEVGYDDTDPDNPSWIFPERDDAGRIVGLMRRYYSSSKMAVGGSMRGLTIPSYGDKFPTGPIYLVEGASDTAALISVGAFAIGRSNAEGNAAERLWLTRLLGRHADQEIIVIGERDESGVGVRAAQKLTAYLHEKLDRSVSWALPRKGFKDSREQVLAGDWHKGLSIQEVLQ